jgi:hypothetical protein
VSFFTRKARANKGADDIQREFNSDNTRAETEHVAVIVFA